MKKILLAGIAIIAIFVIAFLFMRLSPSEASVFDKMEEDVIRINDFVLTVKVADSPEEHAAGFQNIPAEVIEKTAILFVFDSEEMRTFHMRDVAAPLDIAFIDADGVIFQVRRMVPGDKLYASSEASQYALEVLAGFFSAQGIAVGDKLLIDF